MAKLLIFPTYWTSSVARFRPCFAPKTAPCRTSFSAGEGAAGETVRIGGWRAAADRRRYGEPELRPLQFNGAAHALPGALLLRDEPRPLYLRQIVGRVIHLERAKDVLAEMILELLARHHLDQPADDISAGAVVQALAWVEQQRSPDAAQRLQQKGTQQLLRREGGLRANTAG
jgi:hypothetical protein